VIEKREIPAHGQLPSDGKEHRAIIVTDANDIVLIFGTSSVALFLPYRSDSQAAPGRQG